MHLFNRGEKNVFSLKIFTGHYLRSTSVLNFLVSLLGRGRIVVLWTQLIYTFILEVLCMQSYNTLFWFHGPVWEINGFMFEWNLNPGAKRYFMNSECCWNIRIYQDIMNWNNLTSESYLIAHLLVKTCLATGPLCVK